MKIKLLFASLCIGFLFINSQIVFGQDDPTKWGKFEDSLLTMKSYARDTGACAVILSDYGFSYFTEQGQINFERHTRIKIFNKNGYKYANFEIPLYVKNSNKEKITELDGATYNLENGKKVKEKMKNSAVFEEKKDENHIISKFTLPAVKEGSIIEFKYTVQSDFIFNFHDWQFQYDIPVIWSEYYARIFDNIFYNQTMKGYIPLATKDKSDVSESFSSTERYLSLYGKTDMQTTTVNVRSNLYHFVEKDVPAFYEEPFMKCSYDYLSRIEFELAAITGNRPQTYTQTWESINQKLLEDNTFGGQLKRTGLFAEKVKEITANCDNDLKKLKAIYQYVQNNITWNKKYTLFCDDVKAVAKEGKGSVSGVNMVLINMLSAAGFDASPVILSTRSNGTVNPAHPSLSSFDYVVANVFLNGKSYLLDATDNLCTVGMLPPRCLNGNGRMVGKAHWGPIRVDSCGTYNVLTSVDAQFNDKGELTSKIQLIRKDYAAHDFRKNIKNENSQDKYFEKIQKDNADVELLDYKFDDIDSIYKPVKDSYNGVIKCTGNTKSDMIYINPFVFMKETNPFKFENRIYPIDLNYPMEYTYMFKLAIPAGYKVLEKPQNANIALPNNAGKIKYVINELGENIQIVMKYSITSILFLPSDYKNLKEYFGQIVAKQAQQIVLKKQ